MDCNLGAFTPGCSARHLPGFISNLDKIKGKGVDTVAVIAFNGESRRSHGQWSRECVVETLRKHYHGMIDDILEKNDLANDRTQSRLATETCLKGYQWSLLVVFEVEH